MTHFKATRPDGTDFHTGLIDYAKALKSDVTIKHPRPGRVKDWNAFGYISVATVPTDCTAFRWPCRLFEVAPVGESWGPSASMPNKRAAHEVGVLRELPAWQVFGPRGEGVAAIMDRYATLTQAEKRDLYAARGTGWNKAIGRAWAVAVDGRADRFGLGAARVALGGRLGGWGDGRAAYGAALAVLFSGFPKLALSDEDYATLTTPWRKVVDRYGLVGAGISVDVDDCVFRMLTPDEIKVGMAFPRDYLLLGTKREQVKQSGNAVTPPAARDLGFAIAEYLLGVEFELAA